MSLFSPGTELKRFRQGTLPKVAVVVLLFIPLIYGALYLWAFWAPDKHMDALPIALVNEDAPVTLADGTTLDAGQQVVDELLKGRDLGWQVVSAADAASGVSDGTYTFSVTIPGGLLRRPVLRGDEQANRRSHRGALQRHQQLPGDHAWTTRHDSGAGCGSRDHDSGHSDHHAGGSLDALRRHQGRLHRGPEAPRRSLESRLGPCGPERRSVTTQQRCRRRGAWRAAASHPASPR